MDDVMFLDDADVVEDVADGSRPGTPRLSEDMTAAATPRSKTGFFKKHRALFAVIGACMMIGVAVGVVHGLRSTDAEPIERAEQPATASPPKPVKPVELPVKEEPAAQPAEPKTDVRALVKEAVKAEPEKKPIKRQPVKKPDAGSAKPEPCPDGMERLSNGKCVSKKTKPW